jgi:anti-sigma factor RsiW
MICLNTNTQGAEILVDYCAGALDAIRTAELEAHLHECAACRNEVEAQREVWNALDVWPPVEVSPGFETRLEARIAESGQSWWRITSWSRWLPVSAAVAAIAAILLIWNPGSKQPASTSDKMDVKIDVQQVQQALDDMDLLTPVGRAL